jgi:hypothetical protein
LTIHDDDDDDDGDELDDVLGMSPTLLLKI